MEKTIMVWIYPESITDVIVPEYEMNHIQIKGEPYDRDYHNRC